MAKQTFTVGQVLTAAQLTSLQQTAMGGGSATTKTASYVLVAADAGTTVAMTSTSATTITVNTGLFAAGDTVFIQNLGTGACTVTAGTATVATAGSLILPQNDAGILYFTATGTAIFYDYIQAGAVSPLTTKGDVYTFSTSDARLGVGANNTVLTADSTEATGLKWAAPASGGSLTLLSTTALSGSTTTVSSISQAYKNLWILIDEAAVSYAGWAFGISPNATATVDQTGQYGTTNYTQLGGSMKLFNGGFNTSGNDTPTFAILISNYTDAFGYRMPFQFFGSFADTSISICGSTGGGAIRGNAAITSIDFITSNNTFISGTVRIYGVN